MSRHVAGVMNKPPMSLPEVFCCLNIMTGIFVDNAQVSKKTDETVVRQEWEKERRQWLADVAELFYKVDTDSSGGLTQRFNDLRCLF